MSRLISADPDLMLAHSDNTSVWSASPLSLSSLHFFLCSSSAVIFPIAMAPCATPILVHLRCISVTVTRVCSWLFWLKSGIILIMLTPPVYTLILNAWGRSCRSGGHFGKRSPSGFCDGNLASVDPIRLWYLSSPPPPFSHSLIGKKKVLLNTPQLELFGE